MVRPTLRCEERSYTTQGRCIYCLAENVELTDEHIIPFSLNGASIVKKASCKGCAEYINKNFEQKTLNTTLLIPRLLLDLKRRKKKEKRFLPLVSIPPSPIDIPGDEGYNISLDASAYVPICVLPMFPYTCGKLTRADRGGISSISFQFFHLQIDTRPPANEIGFRSPITPYEYCLSIAKMGYSFAVGHFGIDAFDGTEIRDLILGKRDDIANFVGSPLQKLNLSDRNLHAIYIKREGHLCTAIVHLFSSYKVRPYQVVLGRFTGA